MFTGDWNSHLFIFFKYLCTELAGKRHICNVKQIKRLSLCAYSIDPVAKLWMADRNEYCFPEANALFVCAVVKTKVRSNATNTYREMLSTCCPHQYQCKMIAVAIVCSRGLQHLVKRRKKCKKDETYIKCELLCHSQCFHYELDFFFCRFLIYAFFSQLSTCITES